MIQTFCNICLLVYLLISCAVNCIITLDSGDLTSNISGSRISSNGKVRGFIHHSVIKCQIKDHRFRKKLFFTFYLLFQIKLLSLNESFALFSVVSIIFMTDWFMCSLSKRCWYQWALFSLFTIYPPDLWRYQFNAVLTFIFHCAEKVFLNLNSQDKCGFLEGRVVFYSEVIRGVTNNSYSVDFSTSCSIVGLKICLPEQTNTRFTRTRFPSRLLFGYVRLFSVNRRHCRFIAFSYAARHLIAHENANTLLCKSAMIEEKLIVDWTTRHGLILGLVK